MTERSITLYCNEGSSDKVYKTEVTPSTGGWTVNFWFGPRTGTLQSGTKTKSPVSKDEAIKIWEKLVREKKAKGYREGADAPAYTEADGTTKDTGLRPMLLTPATEEDLERFIGDDAWGAQEKLNGKRILLRIEDGEVTGVNRRGLKCPIPKSVAEAARLAPLIRREGPWVLDGELMGEVYHAFDILEAPSGSMRSTDQRMSPMADRHAFVTDLAERVLASPHIRAVPLVLGREKKRALVANLRHRRKEGVVFKRLDGPYDPGRIENLKHATAVKLKFWASAEFVVVGWNRDCRSAALGAYDETGTLIPVGNVSVPEKYAHDVAAGGVVQVRYLYATPGQQLYQPTLDASNGSARRADKSPTECLLAQLKYEGQD